MDADLKLGVILASTREGRRGEGFARWIHALLSERKGSEVALLDLRDWRLPNYDHAGMPPVAEKSYTDPTARGWVEKIGSLDGYVIVTPEYSHGYPGGLKNALDHGYAVWANKPVAFVSYGGTASGARAVEQLRLVAIELRMVPIRDEVNIRLIGVSLDEQGRPTEEFYARRAAAMIDTLLWWARVTREGRERHPLPAR
ncbi:MAG: NADPH-dependent FMN reductase [Polyangiaceae bacterium]|jgi:NAD(P)H-dependent FMN reductase